MSAAPGRPKQARAPHGGDRPQAEGGQPGAAPGRPFSHRAFLYYWLARLASTVASQVQVVAVGWTMYELTDSAMALGLVGLAQFAPTVPLTFVTGAVADRRDRRIILVLCRLAQATGVGLLAAGSAGGWLTPALIYGIAALMGTARAFEMPASQALVPALVPQALLSRATALSSSAQEAATIGGPALGGLLFVAGADLTFGVSSALFALAALGLLAMKVKLPTLDRPRITLAYLFGGIDYMRHHKVLLGAFSLDLFAVLLGGATALLPIYAKDILHTGPWGLGLLRSAPAVGALAVAMWLARHPFERRVGRTLMAAVAVFGLATIVFGVSTWLPLSVVALAVLGGADMVSVVIRITLMQLETPDEMRGRVGAVTSLFIGASNQVGEFESGVTAAWWGAMPSVVAGGLGTLLIVALWTKWFPGLVRRDRMEPEGGTR